MERIHKVSALGEAHHLPLVKQAKMWSFKNTPHYKFGYHVPNDFQEALYFDKEHGNVMQVARCNEAQDAAAWGLQVLQGCWHLWKGSTPTRLQEEQSIIVKHNGRHKSRLVAGGHLTYVPVNSIYSGVVSLQGLWMVTFLLELNDLELCATSRP